jgi:Zinc-binding dehydrogenase
VIVARLVPWNLLPNGRRATFFNLWAGKSRNRSRYYAQLREDLRRVFALLDKGEITAQVARTFPLTEAAEALRYAESGNAAGKAVLIPATRAPAERTVSKPLPVARCAYAARSSSPRDSDLHGAGLNSDRTRT